MNSDCLSKNLLRDIAREEQASEDCECKALTALTTALAAEKLKTAELQATLDLIQTAYERGTKVWQEATGKTMATPDTGDLVQFLCDRAEQAEAKVARLVGKLKDIVNEWESTGDEWADDMYPDFAATITEAATLLADSEEK